MNDVEIKLSVSHDEPGDVGMQDSFMFIGELAKLTNCDPKTIRFYERAELLSPPRHGRFRTYLHSDVQRLQNVLLLRKLGVPIAQIKDILETTGDDSDVLASAVALKMLRSHLKMLQCKQDVISQQIEQTSSVLGRFAA